MAEDHFEQYYAEKLWETIPSIYRHEDGLAEEPGVLRAIVQVIARQAAILRRSQDSLWDDQFIELCNEWAVPYIGDLVATRMLSEKNKRGRRIDVAKTIYYRRRKGTPRILEELISDISEWEGKMVEQFQRLARSRHGLDAKPQSLAGKFSGTLPGGWADIRNQRASELTNGPFEEFFHTPDVRRHKGLHGRYAIPKLAFYLYRLKAYRVTESTPFSDGAGEKFTFDPSGRDVPIFVRRDRPDEPKKWDNWQTASETEMPAPMRCRLLGHEEFFIDEALVQTLVTDHSLNPDAANDLRNFTNHRIRNRERLRVCLNSTQRRLELLDLTKYVPLLKGALVKNCGKSRLYALDEEDEASVYVRSGITNKLIPVSLIQSGHLENWTINPLPETLLVIDPIRGRFILRGSAMSMDVTTLYHYGFSGPIGAGTYDRREVEDCEPTEDIITGGGNIDYTEIANNGVTQIGDSKTYKGIDNKIAITDMTLQAANRERPYIRLTKYWNLSTNTDANADLTLDGLWIGGAQLPISTNPKEIVLSGDFECVVIKNCSIDPGGYIYADGSIEVDLKGDKILPVSIKVTGSVENLFIVSSITGRIYTDGSGIIENLIIEDSIIHSVDMSLPALVISTGTTTLKRVTVFGHIDVHRLNASETLLTGISTVLDTQNSCFRFGAAPKASRLPRPYESFLFEQDTNHWFTSVLFGQPGYGQLSETAPGHLKTGAENGSEMGAFSSLLNPIKFHGLKTKVDEYMPFGLIPIYINKT